MFHFWRKLDVFSHITLCYPNAAIIESYRIFTMNLDLEIILDLESMYALSYVKKRAHFCKKVGFYSLQSTELGYRTTQITRESKSSPINLKLISISEIPIRASILE